MNELLAIEEQLESLYKKNKSYLINTQIRILLIDQERFYRGKERSAALRALLYRYGLTNIEIDAELKK